MSNADLAEPGRKDLHVVGRIDSLGEIHITEIVEPFTPIDAGVAHQAFIDMREAAKRHEERKPGCVQAQTYTKKADQLLDLRNKILDRLPEEFHSHRKAYPDYVVARSSGMT